MVLLPTRGSTSESTGQPHVQIADLTPVTLCPVQDHKPVPIVVDGEAKAVIYVPARERLEKLQLLLGELVEGIG